MPASRASSISVKTSNGADSGALSTTQLPATIAGAALRPTMTALALNGVMAPTTPYGSGTP